MARGNRLRRGRRLRPGLLPAQEHDDCTIRQRSGTKGGCACWCAGGPWRFERLPARTRGGGRGFGTVHPEPVAPEATGRPRPAASFIDPPSRTGLRQAQAERGEGHKRGGKDMNGSFSRSRVRIPLPARWRTRGNRLGWGGCCLRRSTTVARSGGDRARRAVTRAGARISHGAPNACLRGRVAVAGLRNRSPRACRTGGDRKAATGRFFHRPAKAGQAFDKLRPNRWKDMNGGGKDMNGSFSLSRVRISLPARGRYHGPAPTS